MGIPVNDLGQVLTSYSTHIHVQGVSAPLRVPSAALPTLSACKSTGGILKMIILAGNW